MTLLTTVTRACNRLGITAPSAVVSSTDPTIVTLLGLAQEGGIALARRATWSVLTAEHTFTTLAAESQGASSLPSDFGWFVDDTFWNRTQQRTLKGPVSPQDWQRLQATTASPLFDCFRKRGSVILMTPTPTAGHTVAYEYVSKNWCESSGGTDQSAWAADSDVSLLDEELHALDLVWRFKAAKGLDYAEPFRAFELALMQAMTRDGAKPRLDMAGGRVSGPGVAVQEGSWSL